MESVAQGSTVEKPEDPAREGFTFVCWNNGEDEWDFTAPVSGDLSLTAVWQQTEEVQETPEPAASYTVTFDLSDGSEPQTVTAAEGTTVEKPEDPVREGFTFVCWNNDESEWDFSTPVSGDLTLTAVWQEAPAETEAAFTVIFDANGGTNVDAQTVVSGAAAVRPEDPTKEGSIFVCWNNGETEWNFADPVTADLTLTAVWEADPEAQSEEGFVSETHDVFSRIKSTIAPGVTQDIVYAYAKDGKQMVYYVATVDVSRDDVVIQTGYKDQYDNGYGMAKLTEQMAYANTVYSDPEDPRFISEYYTAVAGVKASFYNMSTGQPIGITYIDGVSFGTNSYDNFFAILKDGKTAVIDYASNLGNYVDEEGKNRVGWTEERSDP